MGDFLNAPPNMEPVAIYEDGGGLVSKYEAMAQRYRLEGRRVKISGSCRSACVLALSVPTTCVMPKAVVKAHLAYEADTGRVRQDITHEMMWQLPNKIRDRLEPNLTRGYNAKTTLNYYDLVGLGVPSCLGDRSVIVKSRPVKSTRVVAQSQTTNPISQLFSTIRSKLNGRP